MPHQMVKNKQQNAFSPQQATIVGLPRHPIPTLWTGKVFAANMR